VKPVLNSDAEEHRADEHLQSALAHTGAAKKEIYKEERYGPSFGGDTDTRYTALRRTSSKTSHTLWQPVGMERCIFNAKYS
jgi:hypothetical protein